MIDFLKSIGVLLLGSVGGQFVLIISLPLITRLYSPSEFGAVQTLESLVQMIMMICALSYERAFAAIKSGPEKSALLSLALILAAISSLVGSALSLFVLLDIVSLDEFGISNYSLWVLLLLIFFGKNIFWV